MKQNIAAPPSPRRPQCPKPLPKPAIPDPQCQAPPPAAPVDVVKEWICFDSVFKTRRSFPEGRRLRDIGMGSGPVQGNPSVELTKTRDAQPFKTAHAARIIAAVHSRHNIMT